MKTIRTTAFALLTAISYSLNAQDTEVFRGDWATLVRKAAEEKKFV